MKTQFICQECGSWASKWSGKCEACGAWNSLIEEVINAPRKKNTSNQSKLATVKLKDIPEEQSFARYTSNISEFDRVTGGGIVPGSVLLVGGDPGIGKSTLLLQIIAKLAQKNTCAYVSGEEALNQVRLRAERLALSASEVEMLTATDLSEILRALKTLKDLKVVVIDSIQTMTWPEITAAAGSVSQVRACTQELIHFAKTNNVAVVLVGHVTKEGTIAGPRVLEHMVDCVLYFEGSRNNDFRILRGVKNRFGATDEIGVFSMASEGLIEVLNPSELFLSDQNQEATGTAVFAGIEGTRPILCEIQALVSQSYFPSPKRNTVGFDQNRLSMILAVLESRCGVVFGNKDVYLNIVGGLRVTDPAADLAVAAALISAQKQESNALGAVYFGEVGLTGEVRNVPQAEIRIKEAEKLGFEMAYTSKAKHNFQTHLRISPLKYLIELI